MKDSLICAFRLFVDEPMLRSIQKYTTSHGTLDDKSFSIHLDELESFISIQIARGVLVDKNTPLGQLWNVELGHRIFNDNMSRNRYQTIMKHLRFDKVSSRIHRGQYDKFCSISDTWNSFIGNCQKCYRSSVDLTIDEQLFPCKIKCTFIQHIPNKPDKFGMKFWFLAVIDSK